MLADAICQTVTRPQIPDIEYRMMRAIVERWDREEQTVGYSAAQLARRLGESNSTTHRYLRGLVDRKLLESIPGTYEWKPSAKGRTWLQRELDSRSSGK